MTNANTMFFGTSFTNLITSIALIVDDWSRTFEATDIPSADMDDWLVAINSGTVTSGTIDYEPMDSNQHLDSERSAGGLAAINNMIANGWIRTGTY